MQLKRIQLNGFKSFVDPTTIPIRSCLNAIVGPNGCGKSNIVDAIRWVSGEISAKQLRGQSMSDVIFNGTASRKPLGKASVELLFDNSDHRITGEYAAFSEIAIRREVARDGQSEYFINGVSARRRDLIDLFLGTGLGPRSYAIIEQGMVAQLVEAKPDEMRAHFEEVAGISKYRERRRETETRIRHTQENLERLNDVREELEKQLRHLQRQAKTAEQYKALQVTLRETQAQIKVLQWQRYELERQEKVQMMNAMLTEYEAYVTSQRDCEKNIEKLRLQLQEGRDEHARVQKKFYELGSEIGRLEQQIQHKQEQLKSWQQELSQSEGLYYELSNQSGTQSQEIDILSAEVSALTPKYTSLQEVLQLANTRLAAVEADMRQAQTKYEQQQAEIASLTQQNEITKNNLRHYDAQLHALESRRTHVSEQLATLSTELLSADIDPLQQNVDSLQAIVAEAHTQLGQCAERITQERNAYQQAQSAVLQQQGELQKLEAQHASLSGMQKASLEDRNEGLNRWLREQQLSGQLRLANALRVTPGWERAAEALLSIYFDAICVDSLATIDEAQVPASAMIVQKQGSEKFSSRLNRKTLADIVQDDCYVPGYLMQVYLAETLTEALTLRSVLNSTESVITRDGYWLGVHWLRTPDVESVSEEGFLLREARLKRLVADIQTTQLRLTDLQSTQVCVQQAWQAAETARETQQSVYQESTSALSAAQAALSEKRSRLLAAEEKRATLSETLQQVKQEVDRCQVALEAANNTLLVFTDKLQCASQEKEQLFAQRAQTERVLSQVRQEAQEKKQAADEWQIRLEASKNQLTVLSQSHHANQRQLLQMRERRDALSQQATAAEQPLQAWSETLQSLLAERVTVEHHLQDAEKQFHSLQEAMREQETSLESIVQSLSMMQEQQQSLRMSQQEISVRQSTLQEQLGEMAFELKQVQEGLPQEADLSTCEQNLKVLQSKIDRLGSINLAAIEEHQTVTERKTYLDQQMGDLQEALEVLQNAIRKIDRETRHLFKDTFDKVNHHFMQLFPRIFGGGQSELVLTEEDLLTSGILVRAQPPGKRNATIHMLSGGEKTLTAIALMFAMFQINPAPFCVLDEVDAPLDDLNVGRYCQLVKEMSKDTQFLVISHNKLTIESADHLMGVTMKEPGVSRIVSVDMREAVSMVEEG